MNPECLAKLTVVLAHLAFGLVGIDGLNYLGCFKENTVNDRLLSGASKEFRHSLTPEICLSYCKTKGMRYFGLQYSYECFCSVERPSFKNIANVDKCDYKCDGNSRETCGGGLHLSVYDSEEDLSKVKYMGCYKERSPQARLMIGATKNFALELTNEVCVQFCKGKGFSYAGTQYKEECFCSNDRPHFKSSADEKDCDSKCSGSSEEICGGGWRLSVHDLYDKSTDYVYPNFLGCYEKSPYQRSLLPNHKDDFKELLTPEFCVGYCYRRGYRFAGMEGGTSCYCGNSMEINTKVNDLQCNAPCAGNKNFKCGGNQKLSVYHTEISDQSEEDRLIGCFEDKPERTLSGLMIQFKETNTPRLCLNVCLQLGFKYAGVEYGFDCFCGNRPPPRGLERPESECSMECAGDRLKMCGGTWRVLIFNTGGGVSNSKPTQSNARPVLVTTTEKTVTTNRRTTPPLELTPQTVRPASSSKPQTVRPATSSKPQAVRPVSSYKPPSTRPGVSNTSSLGSSKPTKKPTTRPSHTNSNQKPSSNKTSPQSFPTTKKPQTQQFTPEPQATPPFEQSSGTSNNQLQETWSTNKPQQQTTWQGNRPQHQTTWSVNPDQQQTTWSMNPDQQTTWGNTQPSQGQGGLQLGGTSSQGQGVQQQSGFSSQGQGRPQSGIPSQEQGGQQGSISSLGLGGQQVGVFQGQGQQLGGTSSQGEGRPQSGFSSQGQGGQQGSFSSLGQGGQQLGGTSSQGQGRPQSGFSSQGQGGQQGSFSSLGQGGQQLGGFSQGQGQQLGGIPSQGQGQPQQGGSGKQPQQGGVTPQPQGVFNFQQPGVYTTLQATSNYGTPSAGNTTPKPSCLRSVTEVKGENGCKGQTLFYDDFSEGSKVNQYKWTHESIMPWTPDYEFVVYRKSNRNSFLKNGKLYIKPTLFDDDFVKRGVLDLESCTGQLHSEECRRQGATFNIIPPVESARLTTKDTFSFKYGTVEIRAKLPLGDWIVPEIWLEPKRKDYGTRAYASGRVRIAMARGNMDLEYDGRDIGNRQLEVGILMGVDENIRARTIIRDKADGWWRSFHNYTLIWTPDNLQFFVDGQHKESLAAPGRPLYQLSGFDEELGQTWRQGSLIAPFDKEFYITLGLSVGGMRDFPDDCRSSGHEKPWRNMAVKAMASFWEDRRYWQSTWDDENSALQIEHVKVTAL